jgi:phage tail sheath protein FI
MPEIPDFEHNGITIETTEPASPMGPPGPNVVCVVGTAPNLATAAQGKKYLRIANAADHALIDSTGAEAGSIIQLLKKTHQKTSVVIYAIVVDGGVDLAATTAAVIGGVNGSDRTGIAAMTELPERPTIICAPGVSHQKPVIDALASMGKRLRARVVCDGPSTDTAAALALSASLGGEGTGHDRCIVVDPAVDIYSVAAQGVVSVPGSVVAVGAMAAVKAWESPQNQGVLIEDTARTIEYGIEDKTTEADLLNKNGITAICRTDLGGFSIIGNRTVTGRFIPHVGIEDVIARKLSATSQGAMGKNLTATMMGQVIRRINNFLQDLRRENALIDAEVLLHPTKNSVSNYASGKWFVVMRYGRYSPNEHMVFEVAADNTIVQTYVEGLLNA